MTGWQRPKPVGGSESGCISKIVARCEGLDKRIGDKRMKTGKTSRNQTQHPATQRIAKSAIHPSRWWPAAFNASDHVHLAAANESPFQIRGLPPLWWNTLFGQITAPRVKEFATSNRTNGFRLERDQRDGGSISVNKLDFVCRPLTVDMNDGTNITGVKS